MKRTLTAFVALCFVWLVLSAPAFGYGGPNPPSQAVAACGTNIDKQTDGGVAAGGGPKAGIPAPTNCDHFFQDEGIIGNGPPGP
jgi:hypothetical protein